MAIRSASTGISVAPCDGSWTQHQYYQIPRHKFQASTSVTSLLFNDPLLRLGLRYATCIGLENYDLFCCSAVSQGISPLTKTHAMAVSTPLSPSSRNPFKELLPMPPPLLHTRSGNEYYDRPQTPTSNAFTSPLQTPQGSPSKKQFPPGATDLPNAFDDALNIGPQPPRLQTHTQTKQSLSVTNDNVNRDPFADPTLQQARDESPTRQSNKENAPAIRFGKDFGMQQNHAAISRQEPYQVPDTRRMPQQRGLSSEDLQKLQLPKVKRLANVTQLCKDHCMYLLLLC